MKILADEFPARPRGHDDVRSVTHALFLYVNTINNAASTALNWDFLMIEIKFIQICVR